MLFEEIKLEDYGDVRYQDGHQDGLLQKAIEAAKKLLGLGVPVSNTRCWLCLQAVIKD